MRVRHSELTLVKVRFGASASAKIALKHYLMLSFSVCGTSRVCLYPL